MSSHRYRMIGLAALLLQAGCTAITESESDFTRAHLKWETERPANYDYTLSVSCFCLVDVTRPVVVVVRGNVVESRTYADSGAPVDAAYNNIFPTIDGVFDEISAAFDRHAARVDVTYDPARGFPTTVALVGSFSVADDESWYTLTNFHVR